MPRHGSEHLAPLNADGTGYLLREIWTGAMATPLAEVRTSPAEPISGLHLIAPDPQ